MSTTPSTPSLRQQLAATIRRCAVLVALVVGLAVGCTHGGVTTPQAAEAPSVTTTSTATTEPNDDEPSFDCRIHGNEVCGPGGAYAAGCYVDGELAVAWRDEMRGTDRDECVAVTGTYQVPGGYLTVFADESARFVPAGGADAGLPLVGCDRTAGPCNVGELTGVDADGRLMVAQDLNGDGVVAGDVELGS